MWQLDDARRPVYKFYHTFCFVRQFPSDQKWQTLLLNTSSIRSVRDVNESDKLNALDRLMLLHEQAT